MKRDTRKSLIKKLDRIFSEYIRKRDYGKCISCGKQGEWKTMQAGHYVSRSNKMFRYNEINTNCQCVGCNVFKHGNMIAYRQALVRIYGEPTIDVIERESNKPYKLSTSELELMILEYQQKLKEEKWLKITQIS